MPKTKRKNGFVSNALFYGGFYGKYSRSIAWITLFLALGQIPWLINPVFVKIIVDQYIPNSNIHGILWLTATLAILLVLYMFFHSAFHAFFMKTIKMVSRDLRNLIVRRLQILSLSFLSRSDPGRYYSKIMIDVERAEQFASMSVAVLIKAVIFGSVAVSTMYVVSPGVLFLFVAMMPVYVLLILLFRHKTRTLQHRERVARENLSASVNNFLQTSVLSRMHGNEWFERNKLDKKNDEVVETSTSAQANIGFFTVLNSISSNMMSFMIIVVCALFVIQNTMTYGDMMLFMQLMTMLLGHVQMIIGTFPIIATFAESMGSLREILDAPDIEYNQGKKRVQSVIGDVVFDHVSFQYENTDEPALADVSVTVKVGETIGLVGQSGGGKSTFVNLLLGLYRTEQGQVRIDGMPVNELDMRTVRHHIGVVSQNPIIFTGTVLDNIRHQFTDMPLERVMEAAKMARAHDFITHLPNGYDSILGEGGIMLSGGQKQRIALARTLLRQPKILILDEATSALDLESEALVQQALEDVSKGITTFVIAHRLTTVANVDRLLVFRDGRIVEEGSHEELLQNGGDYANLIRLQDSVSGNLLEYDSFDTIEDKKSSKGGQNAVESQKTKEYPKIS